MTPSHKLPELRLDKIDVIHEFFQRRRVICLVIFQPHHQNPDINIAVMTYMIHGVSESISSKSNNQANQQIMSTQNQMQIEFKFQFK